MPLLLASSALLVTSAKSESPSRFAPSPAGQDPRSANLQAIDARNIHNVGNIWLNITNFGLIGSQPGTYAPWSEAPSAQWPAGSSTEYLWSAGLWVGGLMNGEPRVSTAQVEAEFRPDTSPRSRVYRTSEGEPGGIRAPAFQPDDDGDGATDEDPLDGRDNDGDGRIDEDFAAVSNQMFVCEYGDSHPSIRLTYPDHRPLGLQVQQTSMAWDDSEKRDIIAFQFKITTERFPFPEQVYVGLFADPDIGPNTQPSRAFDDRVGFWEGEVQVRVGATLVPVAVSIGYMWDADGDATDSEGYVGCAFLGYERTGFGTNANNRRVRRLELRNFGSFAGKTLFQSGGDPTNDEERYRVLNGTAPGSLQGIPGRRTSPVRSLPNDYRFVISAGPFGSLSPGDTLAIHAALVIGRGLEEMKEAAARAQLAFDGTWADCDHDIRTGIDGRETAHCGPEDAGRIFPIRGPDSDDLRTVPCDTTCRDERQRWFNLPRCSVRVPPVGCAWIDGDCDVTTGQDGNECLVHWFTGVPPPPPQMRLVARENRVDILFDNRSETVVDPILNVSDFESYRIWRADSWQRPLGSDLDTGPDPARWKLMAEYDRRGGTVGQETGLEDILYTPSIAPYFIEFCREWDRAHPSERPPLLPGFTDAQLDTALALARGVRYYRWVDPGFVAAAHPDDPPCAPDGNCDPIDNGSDVVYRRCDSRQRCRETFPPPTTGARYFYGVTATDHRLELRGGLLVEVGPGLVGSPQSNFLYIEPPSDALRPAAHAGVDREIYVVPNPATRASMAPWSLHPKNDDPTGLKVEFHHLPAAPGKIRIFTLSGDLVQELAFDGRSNGSQPWDLLSRNGQEVTSGVYLFVVEAKDPGFERFVGRFVVVR